MSSCNLGIIVSGTVCRQAIAWSNDNLLSIRPSGTNFNDLFIEIYRTSVKKNSFENNVNVVCKLGASLFRPQCFEEWELCCSTVFVHLTISVYHIILIATYFYWNTLSKMAHNPISQSWLNSDNEYSNN